MNKDVCVLLSTYNGERFLRDQLDSIINQENIHIQLLVRDDGSKDLTLDILKLYQTEGRLTILNSSDNLGPALSFMELLYNSPEADYYAFADQDDIWKRNKLSCAVKQIGEDNIPTLYASNQIIFKNGQEKGYRFAKEPNYTLTGIIFGNAISGCTMVMNKSLRDILINKKHRPDSNVLRIRMHDTWVAAVAASVGCIKYDPSSHILYRIHDSNVVGVGSSTVSKRVSKIIKKIKHLELRNGRSKLAEELLKFDEDIVRAEDKRVIEDIASNNLVQIIKNNTIKKDSPEKRIVLIIKTLLRWN